jgi:dephospho-CoA kinase
MLHIGLTGGIASGKSTVAERFAQQGVTVIDADQVARDVVEPGQPALNAIVERFGTQVLTATGELDRRQLREQVFADTGARKLLEAILHPAIRERMRDAVQACADRGDTYCISMIPLLVETGQSGHMDRVLVVDVDEQVQLERVMHRDDCDASQAAAILASQATREQRLSIADDVIDNRGNLDDLIAQVDRLHQQYLALSRA